MAELLDTVTSWPSLLLALIVFGFAPGFCLRLIVLVYPREDPRRAELVAELYVVPRGQRPFWVAEQLEVALFEGLPRRVSATRQRITRPRRVSTKIGIAASFGLMVGLMFGLGNGFGPGLGLGIQTGIIMGVNFGLGDHFILHFFGVLGLALSVSFLASLLVGPQACVALGLSIVLVGTLVLVGTRRRRQCKPQTP